MACFSAFLALLVANAGAAASQHQSSIVVGVGKLPALAAFMYMANGEEVTDGDTLQLMETLAEFQEENDAEEDSAGADSEDTTTDEAGEEDEGEDYDEGEEDEDDEDDEEAEEEDAKNTFDSKALMDKFDANKDEKLSMSELERKDMPKEKRIVLSNSFARADANKDSFLDNDELAIFVQGVPIGAEEIMEEAEMDEDAEEDEEEEDDGEQQDEPMQMMSDLDTDKDGKLTLKELTASEEDVNGHDNDVASIFATNDKDKDGKLDMQELNVTIQELEKRGY